jgi:hypothetical protein
MDRPPPAEKSLVDLDHIDVVLDNAAQGKPVHYLPQTDEEKRLDRSVNFKLDCFVVSLLALEFIVGTWQPLLCHSLDLALLTVSPLSSSAASTRRMWASRPPEPL